MVKIKRARFFQKHKKWLAWGATLPALGLLWAGFWFFFPLEGMELSNRFEFWKANVTEVQLNGLHAYRTDYCGEGVPASSCTCVALLHGLGDNAMTWKKVLLWPQASWAKMGLGQPIRLFAFDLPGSGESPAPTDLNNYRVRKQAEKLKGAMAEACPHWIVAGNSLGGWIGSWLALDWPEGVKRLLLADSAGLKSADKDKDKDRDKLLDDPTEESLKEFQRRAYFKSRVIPEHVWKAVVARARKGNSKAVAKAQVSEDYLDVSLSTLKIPILFLWGQEDYIIPLAEGYRLRALLPGAGWREIPHCGHLPQKECPLVLIQSIVDLIGFGAA
jgi:pimeloyl-ACP methyl ester carboxylesterase